jgi:hypothetical protein
MPRLRFSSFILALALAGCDSQIHSGATPAAAPLGVESGVPAILAASAAGNVFTIQNPGLLPEAVRNATDLKVAIGTTKVAVSRNPGGYFTFSVPATAKLNPDVAGNVRVVFIMNDANSQIVILKTGSPVQFGTPPVVTTPNPAFVTRGLEVKLRANTDAPDAQYQFTWSAGLSPQGPWTPIPGEGKEVKWTPAVAGNYYIKVDAIERATQQAYSTVTPAATVFVTEGRDVVTTTPTSGSVERGSEVTLQFNRPAGLTGENLSYSWSAGPSAQGPFSPITGEGATVKWLPTAIGSQFVRVEVSNRDTSEVSTFVTPQAIVFVNEGRPIIQPSKQTIDRGDRVDLNLNIASAGNGPFSWYYSRNPAAGFTLISGNNKSVSFVAPDAGSYSFRVDIPQSSGGVKSFTTTEPVLNVTESQPIIQSVPANETVSPGGSTSLQLNARGIEEANYRFVWSVGFSAQGPWQSLPLDDVDDLYKKTRSVRTAAGAPAPADRVFLTPGAYYARVEATERTGTQSYTFVSSGPVFTVQR